MSKVSSQHPGMIVSPSALRRIARNARNQALKEAQMACLSVAIELDNKDGVDAAHRCHHAIIALKDRSEE